MPVSARFSLPDLKSPPVEPLSPRRLSIVAKPDSLDRNHLFANNIRFWSMVSIVAVHSIGAALSQNWLPSQFSFILITFFKFGTIGFFLVAGFLMGERVDRCKPIEYFMRRTNKVMVAWLFWLFMIAVHDARVVLIRNGVGHVSVIQIVQALGESACSHLLHSGFWFIPNFLICIAVLLVFRRYLYTLRLGFCLLAVNLVYVVNIYGLWFYSLHTGALFAFVFFLWLGSYIAHNFQKANQVLDRISPSTAMLLVLITFILSCGESYWLTHLRNPDPLNTLRFSNQLFSLAMALVLFKFTRPTWPRFVDVRRHTFGIYLSHTIVMVAIFSHLKTIFPVVATLHLPFGLGYALSAFLLVSIPYLMCLAITEGIARRSSLRWMVGLSPLKPAPRAATNFYPAGLSRKPDKTRSVQVTQMSNFFSKNMK